jgi:phage/plasmid-like protein (TIGR03299 family)
MPANITISGDRAEMFYVGKKPWHGLGTELPQVATAAEAIEAAGLDWEVVMEPVYTVRPEHRAAREHYRQNRDSMEDWQKIATLTEMVNTLELIEGRKASVRPAASRTAHSKHFGVFSNQYKPLQNKDAFAFFDAVVGAGEAIYHTAGSLAGGRKTWILAKLPGDLKLSDTDILERYILLSNSHDGSLAVQMKPTTIRVVCENTMNVALNSGTRSDVNRMFRAVHTTNVMHRVNQAREVLGLQEAYFALMMQGIERMADAKMRESEVEPFLVKLFGQEEDPGAISTRMRNQMNTVAGLFYSGTGNQGATRWDMLNAVTEWTDHHRGSNQEKRLEAAWFGAGQGFKQAAWDFLSVESPFQVTVGI